MYYDEKKEHSKHKIFVSLLGFCCFSPRAERLDNITMPFKYTKETLNI